MFDPGKQVPFAPHGNENWQHDDLAAEAEVGSEQGVADLGGEFFGDIDLFAATRHVPVLAARDLVRERGREITLQVRAGFGLLTDALEELDVLDEK